MCVCVCVFIFFQFVRIRRKLLLSFRFWRQNGFLKNIPFSSPLCLTSLFHHSAALSRLLWPCLVTAHLCQGAIQSHWWPLGTQESKWQNGTGDRAAWTHVSFSISTGSLWKYHSHAVICTLRHGILWIRKCVWWPAVSVSLTRTMFAVSQRESRAKYSSYATAQHTQLSSVVRQEKTKPRGSLSLNKDTARLPHGVWKANLVQTGSQAAERGLPASFQLSLKDSSCYRPGVSSVWIYWAQKQRCSSLPSLTSINSPIIPSELPFSICVSFSPTTMISLSVAHWLTGYSVACESDPFSSCAVYNGCGRYTLLSTHHCILTP